MKHLKRTNTYKASNVTFNPETCHAYSYGWWRFVDRVNGYTVFNWYRYSHSTGKHQRKVSSLLDSLGIKVDLSVYTHGGLQVEDAGKRALTHAYEVQDLYAARLISKVYRIKFNQTEIQAIYDRVEMEQCDAFLSRSIRREEKIIAEAHRQLRSDLTNYLENKCSFRDYDIADKDIFGKPEYAIACKAAVHQIVEADSIERDVQNALETFFKDGFGSVVFYV